MPLKVIPRRDRKLYRLLKRGEALTLEKGEDLYCQGAPAGKVYLVRDGWLRLTVDGQRGKPRTVGVAGPWEMVGEEALERGSHRRTGARAGAVADLTVLDGGPFLRALGSSEKSLEAYLKAKEDELALARTLAGLSGSGRASVRLAAVLLHLADRLGREEGRELLLPFRLTHGLLGELSTTHRSTVTTLINDWTYRGLVAVQGGMIRVLDPASLIREGTGALPPRLR